MNCRRQALQFCLDPAVVVVIHVFNQFLLEVLHGLKLLQIQQLTFEQPEEIFYHGVVQAVPLAAHALPDTLLAEHPRRVLPRLRQQLLRDAAERGWVKRRRARVEEMRLVNGGAMWASPPTQTEGIFF